MSLRLPEHDHCKFCGDPVPFDQAYCSEECYRNEGARVKKEKNRNYLFVAAVAVSMTVIIAAGIFLP
jgi:predicted nucleic acid-binding Zn ribbon protein